jgi:hypothetical protein
VINMAVAILRVQRRLVAVAAVTVTEAALRIGGALLLWLLMPHLGITAAGWSALAAPVIVASTLAILWRYLSRVSARTAGDLPAFVADGPPAVVAFAPSADVSLPVVVAVAPAADVSLPEKNTDRSGR